MHIDQRHVTTIDLHDGKAHEVSVRPDDRGYRLSLTTRDGVLTILLSADDLRRLGRALGREGGTTPAGGGAGAAAVNYQWSEADWLSYN